jgi:hypothetical protein
MALEVRQGFKQIFITPIFEAIDKGWRNIFRIDKFIEYDYNVEK